MSHFPPVATPLAFLYLFGPVVLLQYAIIAFFIDATLIDWLLFVLGNQFAVGILLGWALQDTAHLMDDDFKFHWKG